MIIVESYSAIIINNNDIYCSLRMIEKKRMDEPMYSSGIVLFELAVRQMRENSSISYFSEKDQKNLIEILETTSRAALALEQDIYAEESGCAMEQGNVITCMEYNTLLGARLGCYITIERLIDFCHNPGSITSELLPTLKTNLRKYKEELKNPKYKIN